MNRLIFVIIILLVAQTTFPQFEPLLDENKHWVEHYSSTDLMSPFPVDFSAYYDVWFQGDTTLNGETCKKLYRQFFHVTFSWTVSAGSSVFWTGDSLGPVELYAMLKEDTSSGVVIDCAGNDTLYDFGVLPGEPLSGWLNDDFQLDSVDQVQLSDGQLRYRQNVSSWSGSPDPEWVIQGIGGTNGMRQPLYYAFVSGYQDWAYVDCYFENSVPLWGDCEFLTVGVEDFSERSVHFDLFPNPTTGQISVQNLHQIGSSELEILDMSGKLVDRIPVTHQSMDIDLSSLDDGFYLIRHGTVTSRFVLR